MSAVMGVTASRSVNDFGKEVAEYQWRPCFIRSTQATSQVKQQRKANDRKRELSQIFLSFNAHGYSYHIYASGNLYQQYCQVIRGKKPESTCMKSLPQYNKPICGWQPTSICMHLLLRYSLRRSLAKAGTYMKHFGPNRSTSSPR